MPSPDRKDRRRRSWRRLYPDTIRVNDQTRERLALAAETGIPAALHHNTGRALARRGLVEEVYPGEFMPLPGALVHLRQPFLRGRVYGVWLRAAYPAENAAVDARERVKRGG